MKETDKIAWLIVAVFCILTFFSMVTITKIDNRYMDLYQQNSELYSKLSRQMMTGK